MDGRAIALGFFDGVHLGHGALLRRTVEEARRRGVPSVVFTFDRPPKEVVTGVPCPLIVSQWERADLARRLYGIDEVIAAPFDQRMRTTSWEAFVTELLIGRFRAVHLVAGHDHRFGYKNQGTPELLRSKCAELGIGCDIVPKVELDGIAVSSSHIRDLIRAGDMEGAGRFLGHPHVLTQEVRHGRRIGRAMGVPTVNLVLPERVLSPAFGVYVTRVVLADGRRYGAVTNVGDRPTVDDGGDVTVESWIQGFDGDLYGQTVRVEFFHRIRDQIRFPSLDALRAQIAADADAARDWWAARPGIGA